MIKKYLKRTFSRTRNDDEPSEKKKGWIGVDLDGTLAHYDGWYGPAHIGEPVPAMLTRVKDWLADGREVRIFTARASVPEYVPFVTQWLGKQGLPALKVTNVKDFAMVALWDDRCVQVETNSGKPKV